MTGNNFALELTVGIEDLFTKEQQRIEKGAKTLEKQFKTLQKTSGDVTEYRRMKTGLEQIGKASGTTSREFQEQERQLQKYAESLRRAEVNVSRLTQEQRRLNEQLREAKQAAEGVRSLSADMAALAGTVAGVAVVSGTVVRGTNAIKMEKQAELQTGRGPGYFSSRAERTWLHQARLATGATEEQAMEARILADNTGADEATARDMALRTLQLQRAMPRSDINEISRALRQAELAFGTNAQTSSDLIYSALTKAGDRANDLLDTFNEYAPLMKDAGFTAEQFTAMLIKGAQSGAFNYDKVADAVKESFKARLADPAQLEALMGTGTKKGEIDLRVKDKGMRDAIKSAIGEFRQASATGGDLSAPWMKLMTLLTALHKADPSQGFELMTRVVGTQGTEDLGIENVIATVDALNNPQAVLGEYQGRLAEGVKNSLSSMERLSNSWDVTVSKFAKAVGDFTENLSPVTDFLAKGLDKTGNFIEENPGTALASGGILAALLSGVGLGKLGMFKRLKGLFGKGSIADWMPDGKMPGGFWPDELSLPGPQKSGGGWWRTALDKMKKLGGGKGWMPAGLGLLFGGAQLYDAAQSGDNAQLAVTTAGMGGGALGAYGGAALGTMVLPGIGTGIGGVLGGILGSILGEEGMQALVNLFDGGKADQEMARLLPPPSLAKPTETGTTPAPPPAIALSQQLAITISPDFSNATELEAAITRAFRVSSPELLQEFQATLERVMQGMDYAQGSS